MKLTWLIITLCMIACIPVMASGTSFNTIAMHQKNTDTYYVKGIIADSINTEFMVDTGSGYVVINRNTLQKITNKGQAEYVKTITGILADGRERHVPIWKISTLSIGDSCKLENVEVAVFEGKTRQILGLRALKQAGPFTMSFEPPELTLTSCL
jgi:predicted aspartyl protease